LQREDYVRYDDLPLETSTASPSAWNLSATFIRSTAEESFNATFATSRNAKQAEAKRKEYSHNFRCFPPVGGGAGDRTPDIARELHDEIGQALTVMQLNLQSMLLSPDTEAVSPRLNETLRVVERVLEQRA